MSSYKDAYTNMARRLIRSNLMGGEGYSAIVNVEDEKHRVLRQEIEKSPWEPPPEAVDLLTLYPWRNQVSKETAELYKIWNTTGELPDPLLDQVPDKDVPVLVQGEKQQTLHLLKTNLIAGWGKLNKLLDFLSAGWRKLISLAEEKLGNVLKDIRELLAYLARKVDASGGFTLEFGTTGVSYQLHFDLSVE